MSFCLFVLHLFCKKRSPVFVCVCGNICMFMYTHCFYICHMHPLWFNSCLPHVNIYATKTGSIFAPGPSYYGYREYDHTATLSQTAVWHLYAHPQSGGNLPLSVLPCFPFQYTVFMTAVNVQKPSFVIDRVHFDLDSQQGLSLGPVGPCSVHFTQLSLNPVRGIGFGRSGISLGFTIWNHISFSFSESLGE